MNTANVICVGSLHKTQLFLQLFSAEHKISLNNIGRHWLFRHFSKCFFCVHNADLILLDHADFFFGMKKNPKNSQDK